MEQVSIASQSGGLLVIRLLDAYTSAPPRDPSLTVTIRGVLNKLLRKPDGLFVFQNVPEGVYEVTVSGGLYHGEVLQVDTAPLDRLNPVVLVVLNPSPAYAFEDGATLVRANVRDEQNTPLGGVAVRAIVTGDSCAKARLAQETDKKGSRELALTRVAGRLNAGDRYWLQDADGKQGERCVIAQVDQEARTAVLEAPLQRAYKRGALLQPLVESRSDRRGELVLGFGNYRTKQFEARIEFLSADNIVTVKEVSVQEGQMMGLGAIPIKVVG